MRFNGVPGDALVSTRTGDVGKESAGKTLEDVASPKCQRKMFEVGTAERC